jgi:hypothetical protein
MNVMHEIKLLLPWGSSAVGVGAFCPQTATSLRHQNEKLMLSDNIHYISYLNSETSIEMNVMHKVKLAHP